MSHTGRFWPLNVAAALLALSMVARGQSSIAATRTHMPDATVVLTPEFCATKIEKSTHRYAPFPSKKEGFLVGPATCQQIERVFKSVFRSVTRIERESSQSAPSGQVILVPRFVELGVTTPGGLAPAFSDRELVVLVEWTAKNADGRTIWTETVQGSAEHQLGVTFTVSRNRTAIVDDAVKDLVQKSARKMAEAPELRLP